MWLGELGLGEMGLGELGLGEIGQNPYFRTNPNIQPSLRPVAQLPEQQVQQWQ